VWKFCSLLFRWRRAAGDDGDDKGFALIPAGGDGRRTTTTTKGFARIPAGGDGRRTTTTTKVLR
jgi:hypothetical protein